jgi:hypothetical protein
MTDNELRDYVIKARKIAAAGGTLHSLWDWIMDAEAILAGRSPFATREQVELHLKTVIDRRAEDA